MVFLVDQVFPRVGLEHGLVSGLVEAVGRAGALHYDQSGGHLLLHRSVSGALSKDITTEVISVTEILTSRRSMIIHYVQ